MVRISQRAEGKFILACRYAFVGACGAQFFALLVDSLLQLGQTRRSLVETRQEYDDNILSALLDVILLSPLLETGAFVLIIMITKRIVPQKELLGVGVAVVALSSLHFLGDVWKPLTILPLFIASGWIYLKLPTANLPLKICSLAVCHVLYNLSPALNVVLTMQNNAVQ